MRTKAPTTALTLGGPRNDAHSGVLLPRQAHLSSRPQTSEHWHSDRSTELPSTEASLGLYPGLHIAPEAPGLRPGLYPGTHIPLNCCYKTRHQIPPGWGTHGFSGQEPNVSPFAWQSNEAILFYFTLNSVSEIRSGTGAQRPSFQYQALDDLSKYRGGFLTRTP